MNENTFSEYVQALKQIGASGTEHSYRTPFENLLNAIKTDESITILHEPQRQQGFGAPDFRVERNGAILGYIETKKPGESLDNILKSGQIKKYLSFVPNLIVTNYHEFILLKDGKIHEHHGRETLFHLSDLDTLRSSLETESITKVQQLFKQFFLSAPQRIGDAKLLAIQLAERGKILKDYIAECFAEQADPAAFASKIQHLHDLFKENLVKELTPDDFADAYAQTVIYGFFLARLQSAAPVTLFNASHALSSSFPVIQELFSFISHDTLLPAHVTWIFQEILHLINHVDLPELARSLSFRQRGRHQREQETVDPYLYFYETFLGEFDQKKRKSKGVYYTPAPVVGFITRSVQRILHRDFHKAAGFADTSVTVLDFAAGTGTFLVSIFELLLTQFPAGERAGLVRDHLLKHFYGFEYLVAPYSVAHLKLSQLLKEYGYDLQGEERLHIYLTDTLDSSRREQVGSHLFAALAQEGSRATEIKDNEPILIITGNPPYNSRSTGQKMTGLMDAYKPAKEKNIQPLNDDYLKFIRFAHDKIVEKTQHGIIGVITNNSYLNGLIHRQMRNALLRDFNEIYILNLHGNARIQERSPDGTQDENVFDIMQGVAISLFIRTQPPRNGERARVWYADFYGKQQAKYDALNAHDVTSLAWEELNIEEFNAAFRQTRWGRERFQEDLSFFVPTGDLRVLAQYGDFWGMHEIFKQYKIGIATGKDREYIRFDLNFEEEDGEKVKTINYRPFDDRFILYDLNKIQRARYEIMQHFIHGENLGITFLRLMNKDNPTYFFITDKLVDRHLLDSAADSMYVAPLYIYTQSQTQTSQLEMNVTETYLKDPNFTVQFRNFLKECFSFHLPTPENILAYIYAICYVPTYRQTYLEFLKIDFPRIPFVRDYADFQRVAALGQELIDMHLMRTAAPEQSVTFPIAGDDRVETVQFVESSQAQVGRVYVNTTQYFEAIPTDVWTFTIGGYQVLDKWLKSRKGRVLSYQDKQHVKTIVTIAQFTLRQMLKLDELWCEVMTRTA